MSYWLGVVSSKLVYENIKKGIHSWFCLTNTVNVGDKFFLYATGKVIKTGGIFGYFEVVKIDASRIGECRTYGGSNSDFSEPTIFTEFKCLQIFDNEISISLLKSDPIISKTAAVRRSFRGTCFSISTNEHAAILKVLTA
jgi:hypothetical protein